MKDIKLFIASSAELDSDKSLFDIFLSEKNKVYKDRYMFFNHRTWRDFVSSVSQTRLQDRYNDYIKECDIVIFLFHSRVGQYTLEEFKVAHEQFLKSQGRKPKIYVYYKEAESVIPEIEEFKAMDIARGHFYDTYRDDDELLRKFNRQIELLENEGFIKPQRIDIPKIIKYGLLCVLLPLVIVTLSFMALYWFKPQSITLNINPQQTENLRFKQGEVTLAYSNIKSIKVVDANNMELTFKDVHSRYMGRDAQVVVSAPGYVTIDTLLPLREIISLDLNRDNSLSTIVGEVMDSDGMPVKDAKVIVGEITTSTDALGQFKIKIPLSLQDYQQRIVIIKRGYHRWDFTGAVSINEVWRIVLKTN